MLETLFILLVLCFFMIPRATLAFVLGIWTVYCVFRAAQLWSYQPHPGKLLLKIRAVSALFNLLLSAAMAFALSSMVNILILENGYLFIFNLVFCFFISLRWFDYSQAFYQFAVLKFYNLEVPAVSSSAFVVCEGRKRDYGFGSVYLPIFFDAGFLYIEDNQFIFKGVLGEYCCRSCDLLEIIKRSSDCIRLIPQAGKCPLGSEILDFKFKDQFYPFKSRRDRDRIIDLLTDNAVSQSSASLK